MTKTSETSKRAGFAATEKQAARRLLGGEQNPWVDASRVEPGVSQSATPVDRGWSKARQPRSTTEVGSLGCRLLPSHQRVRFSSGLGTTTQHDGITKTFLLPVST